MYESFFIFFPQTFQCGLFKRKRGKKRGYNIIDEEQEEAEGEGGGEIGEEGEEGEKYYDYVTRNDTAARNEAYGVTGDVSLTSNNAYGLVA